MERTIIVAKSLPSIPQELGWQERAASLNPVNRLGPFGKLQNVFLI